jgi:hypothetical protein
MQLPIGTLLWLAAAPALWAQETLNPELTRLSWMEGRWQGVQDGLAMEEHWTSPAGDALLGMHKDVKDGKLVSFEFLRVERTAAGVRYLASPRSALPTPFLLVEIAERRVVFENKDLEFPHRILYWLAADGALHARIEGSKAGKPLSEEWSWTRAR